MNISSSKSRGGSLHHHNTLNRTRLFLFVSALVITTFILTRLFDRPCGTSGATIRDLVGTTSVDVRFVGDGSMIWPERGFGRDFLLRIYVYDEEEVDGLDSLMRGRDGKIEKRSCVKGQWGTQVKIHWDSLYIFNLNTIVSNLLCWGRLWEGEGRHDFRTVSRPCIYMCKWRKENGLINERKKWCNGRIDSWKIPDV